MRVLHIFTESSVPLSVLWTRCLLSVVCYNSLFLFLFVFIFFHRFVVAVIFSFLTQFVIKKLSFFLSHFCVFPVLIEVISDNDPFFGDCFHCWPFVVFFVTLLLFYEFRALFWVLFLLLPHLNFGHNGIKPHFFSLCPQIPNVV